MKSITDITEAHLAKVSDLLSAELSHTLTDNQWQRIVTAYLAEVTKADETARRHVISAIQKVHDCFFEVKKIDASVDAFNGIVSTVGCPKLEYNSQWERMKPLYDAIETALRDI